MTWIGSKLRSLDGLSLFVGIVLGVLAVLGTVLVLSYIGW
jgi:hypothetical protein